MELVQLLNVVKVHSQTTFSIADNIPYVQVFLNFLNELATREIYSGMLYEV